MTLEELQERYPHGSRWRCPYGTVTVIAIDTDRQEPHVVWRAGATEYWASTVRAVENDWTRIPDPPPCPITEPVTLYPYEDRRTTELQGRYPHTSDATLLGGPPIITLWPPGEAPDPKTTRGGIWTWRHLDVG